MGIWQTRNRDLPAYLPCYCVVNTWAMPASMGAA